MNLVRIYDVDTLPDAAPAGVEFLQTDPPMPSRRWRPAIMTGLGVEAFIPRYFSWPAHLPRSGLIRAQNASVIADGLVEVDRSLLVGSSLMYPASCFPYKEQKLGASQEGGFWRIDRPKREVFLEGLTCDLSSLGLGIYGHWIVDTLPRIDRILRSDFNIDRYLLPGPTKPWKEAMLALAGISPDKVIFMETEANTYLCQDIVIPTYDRFNSELKPSFLKAHLQIIDRLDAWEKTPELNLFISRAKWGGVRQLKGREEVEDCFVKLGFSIIFPEKLTFEEQVRLFARAKIVVGECGSGMHNAVYCQPGTKIGVIQSSSNQNYLQAQIAMLANQEIWYLVGKDAESNAQIDRFELGERDASWFARAILN